MVCDGTDGPDPPETNPYENEISARPRQEIEINGPVEDSDEEVEHFGYEPLPQGPETVADDPDSSDEDEDAEIPPLSSQVPNNDVPSIETMEVALTREVWNTPRSEDPIQMDTERVREVMSAMANFVLPQTSIPEWAKSISEDQWKGKLYDKIEKLKDNT